MYAIDTACLAWPLALLVVHTQAARQAGRRCAINYYCARRKQILPGTARAHTHTHTHSAQSTEFVLVKRNVLQVPLLLPGRAGQIGRRCMYRTRWDFVVFSRFPSTPERAKQLRAWHLCKNKRGAPARRRPRCPARARADDRISARTHSGRFGRRAELPAQHLLVPPTASRLDNSARKKCPSCTRTNLLVERLSLNRSQCGGCSTKYDTPTES